MSPFQSVSLVLAGMVAAPAGCFLSGRSLLLVPAAFVAAGCMAWGPRWILRLLVACSVPLIVLGWAAVGHNLPAAERSARWALAAGSGLFFATLAGTARISWWLGECSKGGGPAGRLLGDLSVMLRSARPAALRARDGLRRGGLRRLAGAMVAVRSSVEEAVTQPPPCPPPAVHVAAPLAGMAAWLFAMAGLAGF